MLNFIFALALVAVQTSGLAAGADQKTLGCFKDGKDLFTKLNGLVYEPNKITRGGVVHLPAANNKYRRVVFKPGTVCPSGHQFLIVYDDLVADFTTDPHKRTKKPTTTGHYRMFDR